MGKKIGASFDNYSTDFSAVLAQKFGRWEKIYNILTFEVTMGYL
jgi:hypothetical protein